MNHQHGLSEKTVEAIRSVLARHPEVEQAMLFGSRAKGTYKRGSDIDLFLKGSNLSQRLLSRVYGELDDLPIPYEFSLIVDEKVIDPDILDHITRVGLSFYERATG